VYATGWHNAVPSREPAGSGLRITAKDRDRYFDRTWEDEVVEFDGAEPATVSLSPSFWRSCSELRSAGVGRWLLDLDAAPWAQGHPPGVVVTLIEGSRFAARLLERRSLGR
jgi:hypothetical protein